MGNCNCCRRESATVWASLDEWEEIAPRKQGTMMEINATAGDDSASAAPLQDQVVKIKITKRELEGIIASARVHDVPVDRLLSRLINAVDHPHSHVQRLPSWSPVLHTIPE